MWYLLFLLLLGCPGQSEKSGGKLTRLQIDGIPDDDNLELGSNLEIKVTFEGRKSEEVVDQVILRIDCDRQEVYNEKESLVNKVAEFSKIEVTNKFTGLCVAKASLTTDWHFYYNSEKFRVGASADGSADSCQPLHKVEIHLGKQVSLCDHHKFELSPQCGDTVAIFSFIGSIDYPKTLYGKSNKIVVVASGELPDTCQLKIDDKYHPIKSKSLVNPIKEFITSVSTSSTTDELIISFSKDLDDRRLYLSVAEGRWRRLSGGQTSFAGITGNKIEVLVSEKESDHIWWDYYLNPSL